MGRDYFKRPGSRWEDNTKNNLEEMECENGDWIQPAQDKDHLQKQSAANIITLYLQKVGLFEVIISYRPSLIERMWAEYHSTSLTEKRAVNIS
jgi:hypothetical protein